MPVRFRPEAPTKKACTVHSALKYTLSILAIGVSAGLALAVWAFFIEPARIRYREYPIHISGWPQQLSGFTVAFITDTHVGSPHISLAKLENIVNRTNALNPDLTLLGGDYVIQGVLGGSPVPSAHIASVLGNLRARHGVFGILGNHDHWDDAIRMRQEFTSVGIPMLENTARPIKVGSHGFWLVGISDYSENQHDIQTAMAAVTTDDPVIVLTHSPDVFPELPPRAALTLAGHTHGGQVYVPFLGRLVVPSRYGPRYALGHILEGGRQLFVGSGIGTSILPVRFLTPPEVSILKIYPAEPPLR